MIRTIKALGLLTAAALCAGALAAPAAQAEEGSGVFTSGLTEEVSESPEHTATTLWGEQRGTPEQNYLRTEGGNEVTCGNEGVRYRAEASGADTEITTEEPEGENTTYQDCIAEGANDLAATVTMAGCHYRFGQPVKLQESEYTGLVDLICPDGKSIVIHVYLFGTPTGNHSVPICTIEVKPGAETEHVITTDKHTAGRHDEVTITATVEHIQVHKSGACGEADEEADFHSLITAYGEDHDVWIG
jgi:hypothetical protein